MVKALKVVMIVYGVVLILLGLASIIMPDKGAELTGFGEIADYTKWYMAVLGAGFIAAGIWIIVAGRNPLRNIIWVKYVITLPILLLVTNIYSIFKGYVDFGQVSAHIVGDIVFAILFLIFTPGASKKAALSRSSVKPQPLSPTLVDIREC